MSAVGEPDVADAGGGGGDVVVVAHAAEHQQVGAAGVEGVLGVRAEQDGAAGAGLLVLVPGGGDDVVHEPAVLLAFPGDRVAHDGASSSRTMSWTAALSPAVAQLDGVGPIPVSSTSRPRRTNRPASVSTGRSSWRVDSLSSAANSATRARSSGEVAEVWNSARIFSATWRRFTDAGGVELTDGCGSRGHVEVVRSVAGGGLRAGWRRADVAQHSTARKAGRLDGGRPARSPADADETTEESQVRQT